MRDRFIIHVCPVCNFYDADPVLRRMPGSRHGPMRCFRCGSEAAKALDLSRVTRTAQEWHRDRAYKSAPLMEPVEVIRAS